MRFFSVLTAVILAVLTCSIAYAQNEAADVEPALDPNVALFSGMPLFEKMRQNPGPYLEYLKGLTDPAKGFIDSDAVAKRQGAYRILSMADLPEANQMLVDGFNSVNSSYKAVINSTKNSKMPPANLSITERNLKATRLKLIQYLARAKEKSVYEAFLDVYETSDFVTQSMLNDYFDQTTDKSLAPLLRQRYEDPNSKFSGKQEIGEILSRF